MTLTSNNIHTHINNYDRCHRTGLLSADNVKHICHVALLPLSDQFIDGVMMA